MSPSTPSTLSLEKNHIGEELFSKVLHNMGVIEEVFCNMRKAKVDTTNIEAFLSFVDNELEGLGSSLYDTFIDSFYAIKEYEEYLDDRRAYDQEMLDSQKNKNIDPLNDPDKCPFGEDDNVSPEALGYLFLDGAWHDNNKD